MRSRKNGGIIGARNDIQSQSRNGVYTHNDIIITNTNNRVSRSWQDTSETSRWVGAGVDPYYDTVAVQFGDALSNSHILQDQSGNHWEDWSEAAYSYMPNVVEFGPSYADWCTNFSADNGFYQVKNTTDMQFGTGAFTIEAWIKPMRQNNGGNLYLFGRGGQAGVTSGTGWTVFLNSSYQLCFYDAVGNSTTTHQTTLNLDTWYHIAVVRTSTASNGLQIYVNGVINGGTGTSTGNFTDNTTWWYIGSDRVNTSTTRFMSRMTEMRITKSAVYTGAFTPPSSAMDMGIANVVYSMSCTINNHDNISAVQSQGKFVSRSGYGGSPASNGYSGSSTRRIDSPYNVNGSVKYYGNGYHSAFCPDTNRYLMIYDTNPSKSLKFAANNFTIEAWVYCMNLGVSLIGKGSGGQGAGAGWTFHIDGNGSLVWWDGNSSYTSNTSITTCVQPTGWYHVAAVRSSTSANGFNMFINGVNVYSGTLASNYTQTNEMRVFSSRDSSQTFSGYVSSLRISSNARYTGSTTNGTKVFTPSIANTTISDANTTYLICAQGNNVPTQTYGEWTDRGYSRMSLYDQLGGTQMPFQQSAICRFGHSWSFEDAGQNRMKATATSAGGLDFGTGDFSVEFWACPKWQNRTYASSEIEGIIDFRDSFTDNGFVIRRNGAYHSIDVLFNGTNTNGGNAGSMPVLTASNITMGFRKWTHVCVQRTGGKLALYINGKLNQEVLYPYTVNTGNGYVTIGNHSYPNLQYTQGFYGWLCDIRVLKGSGAYSVKGSNPEYIQLPTSNLTAISNTVLLCANSPNIVDNSGVNFVSWPRGDGNDTQSTGVQVSNYTPYSSVEFSNTTYLAGDASNYNSPGWYETSNSDMGGLNQRSNFSFINRMSTPWTIECFVWPDQVDVKNGGTNGRVFLYNASGGGQEGFRIVVGENNGRVDQSIGNNYNAVKFDLWSYDWNNNVNYQSLYFDDDQTLQSACWNHIAIVYDPTQPSANQMALFVNGKRKVTSSAFTPGFRPGSYDRLNASSYTSGCRISNSARYNNSNTTITIPTTMWTYDANTTALVNWEGPFTDRAGKMNSQWARVGVSTTYKKFGNGSMHFTNKYFSNPQQTNPYQIDRLYIQANNYMQKQFDFRHYDWTIEGWACWHDSTAGGKAFSVGNTGINKGTVLWHFNNILRVGIDINGKWQMMQADGSYSPYYQVVNSNIVVSTVSGGAKFDHVVMMRRKGNIIFYVNGQEIGQMSQSFMGQYGSPAYPVGNWNWDINQDINNNPYIKVGCEASETYDQGWCGYLQDFRVSAMARYDTRVINGVSTMVFAGTNVPALPVISAAPHPTRGF